jgi:hypothetical protein
MRKASLIRMIPSEKREVTHKIWPDSITKSINKVPNLTRGHRKPKSTITLLENSESKWIPTNATLQSSTNGLLRENQRGQREGYHQEELKDGRRGNVVNSRSETPTDLISQGLARREIPMKKSIHDLRIRLEPMAIAG